MPVQNLVAELKGTFPTLPVLHAVQLINRAWTRVRDIRLWSWNLVVDAQWFAPGVLTVGSVSTVAQNNIVTVDTVAATALNADPTTIPLIAGPIGIGRQILRNARSIADTRKNFEEEVCACSFLGRLNSFRLQSKVHDVLHDIFGELMLIVSC